MNKASEKLFRLTNKLQLVAFAFGIFIFEQIWIKTMLLLYLVLLEKKIEKKKFYFVSIAILLSMSYSDLVKTIQPEWFKNYYSIIFFGFSIILYVAIDQFRSRSDLQRQIYLIIIFSLLPLSSLSLIREVVLLGGSILLFLYFYKKQRSGLVVYQYILPFLIPFQLLLKSPDEIAIIWLVLGIVDVLKLERLKSYKVERVKAYIFPAICTFMLATVWIYIPEDIVLKVLFVSLLLLGFSRMKTIKQEVYLNDLISFVISIVGTVMLVVRHA